jgi:hypothetical protein
MPSALFRRDPVYAYAPDEKLERCAITDLREQLVEPLVEAGVERAEVLEAQENELAFRRLVAQHLDSRTVTSALDSLFEKNGELGDIRKMKIFRFDPARAGRLEGLAPASAAQLPPPFATRDLHIQARTRQQIEGLGRVLNLRIWGNVQGPGLLTRAPNAEVRVYLDLGYWVDAYREDDEIARRVADALSEFLGPETEPAARPPRGLTPGGGAAGRQQSLVGSDRRLLTR